MYNKCRETYNDLGSSRNSAQYLHATLYVKNPHNPGKKKTGYPLMRWSRFRKMGIKRHLMNAIAGAANM